MKAELYYQNEQRHAAPDEDQLRQWIEHTLDVTHHQQACEVTVRIVDETEMQALNGRYRGRHTATNVLAFAAGLPPELELPALGDIAICAPVVEREALDQAKLPRAHWAHMVVHGTLHLLGYDHQTSGAAEEMESLETQVLTAFAFAPPYEPKETLATR